jgi:hypothetical protein
VNDILNEYKYLKIVDMGTSEATLRPEDSIRAQLNHLDRLTLQDSGIYLEYNGNIAPW